MANNEKTQISTELKADYGGAKTPDTHEPIKENVMSYNDGQIYIALKKVSVYDPATNTYSAPKPRMTSSFGGHFVDLGLSGKRMRKLADFMEQLAQALEGVEISGAVVNGDVDLAKKFMSSFREQ